jgi:hypothetical protein
MGWVSVRADLDGGAVHASLVPGSPDAGAMLGAHLPGLNAYLAEHHGSIAAVTVTSPETRFGDAGSSGESAANPHGANSGSGEGPAENSAYDRSGAQSVQPLQTASVRLANDDPEVDYVPPVVAVGGTHISAMA